MAELRNPTGGVKWDPDRAYREAGLSSPFPRNISHGDTDCETEINGRFLNIEFKRDGEQLNRGQELLCRARWRDGRTVLIVRGIPPTQVHSIAWFCDCEGTAREADVFTLWTIEDNWSTWAEEQPRPIRRHAGFNPFRVQEAVS